MFPAVLIASLSSFVKVCPKNCCCNFWGSRIPWLQTTTLPSGASRKESWLSLAWEIESRLKYTRTVLSVWKPRSIWSSIPFCSICSRLMPRLASEFQSILFTSYLYCGCCCACPCCGASVGCCCCCPAAGCTCCSPCCCACAGCCTSYCAMRACPSGVGFCTVCWKSAATRCTSSSGTRKKWKRVGSFNWFQRLEKKLENISPWRSTRSRSLLSSNGFLVCNSPSFTPLTAWMVFFS